MKSALIVFLTVILSSCGGAPPAGGGANSGARAQAAVTGSITGLNYTVTLRDRTIDLPSYDALITISWNATTNGSQYGYLWRIYYDTNNAIDGTPFQDYIATKAVYTNSVQIYSNHGTHTYFDVTDFTAIDGVFTPFASTPLDIFVP